MQKRDILNSPRLQEIKRRRRKIFFRKVFIYFFLFLIIIACFTGLSRINKLNISGIEISGNQVIDTEIIKNTVTETLDGNYFLVFPKNNLLFYSKNNITKALAEKFKRLGEINIITKQGGVLEISVTERIPKYTWCGEILPIFIDKIPTCYFLDDTGFIFDEAPQFSGDVYFKFYGKIPEGYFFKNFILFKNNLETIGLKPVAYYKALEGDAKIYLSSNISTFGPEIIFKENPDFKKLTENLQSALDVEPLHTDFKKKYSSLLYIDLRYGNKVYYKFSN